MRGDASSFGSLFLFFKDAVSPLVLACEPMVGDGGTGMKAEVAIYHVQAHQELRFQSSGQAASRRGLSKKFWGSIEKVTVGQAQMLSR